MWTGLTITAVDKYLPDISPATDKGHMKRQRKVLRTTQDNMKEKLDMIEMERDIHPPVELEKMNQIFYIHRKSQQEIQDNLRRQYRKFTHQKH